MARGSTGPDAGGAAVPAELIGSVDRALRVLLALRDDGSVTLTSVSRALGVSPSTAHRLLATLSHRGFARQDAATRAYLPGRALLEVGLAAAGGLDAPRVARPALEALSREVEETVHLVLLDAADVVFLDSVESRRAARVTARTGMSLPAHCTAAGKVLLAGLDDTHLRALLGPEPLARRTPRSSVTWEQLRRDLQRIRAVGYATNFAESERGVSAVAVAIPGTATADRLSVSVSVPAESIDAAREAELAAAARAAATVVAGRLSQARRAG